MKKFILLAAIATCPLYAGAIDVNVNLGGTRVEAPGMTITFGSRDRRGYYWDGYEYRAPEYWKRHHGPRGEKFYTGHDNHDGYRDDRDDHHRGSSHCPPGQGKKGRC